VSPHHHQIPRMKEGSEKAFSWTPLSLNFLE
jgi:hypothetical protein